MSNQAALRFSITPRLTERETVIFTAWIDDEEITAERYSPGDGKSRRDVAARWAKDDRLRNGSPTLTTEIVRELESAEREALAERDRRERQETSDEPIALLEKASHVDADQIAELAWNLDASRTDFIYEDLATSVIERSGSIKVPGGIIGVPSICQGIVTPGQPLPGTAFVPTEHDPAGRNEARLRQQIEMFINTYVELEPEAVSICVEYVLLSWVFDAFDELPYLAFRTADAGRGKSRALETVGAICYRPLICGGGSSAAATLRLVDTFGGTLVADEFDQKHDSELAADLNRILNQGFQRGRPLVKCDGKDLTPRPFKCFGPKLFALRQRLGDDATESRTLSVRMRQRTRRDVPINLPRAKFDDEARRLRNRLLAWRFANCRNITVDPSLADPELEDRANQIGLPLLAVARSDDVRARIVAALKDQQISTAAERADTLAGEVFEAILRLSVIGGFVRPGEVAIEVNGRRAEQAATEPDRLGRRATTPHRIGKVLGSELELPRVGRDRAGVRFKLDSARMEQLAMRFGGTPLGSTQVHHVHPASGSASENPQFWAENGENALGAHGALPVEGGALTGDDVHPSESEAGDEADGPDEGVPF